MRAHPSPDLQFNVILSFSDETSVFFAASSTLKSIILSPTTPKVMKALEDFFQSAISKLPIIIIIMTLTSACDDGGNDDYDDGDDGGNENDADGNDNVRDNDGDDDDEDDDENDDDDDDDQPI